ncbi:LysR family transcriptional regulator [Coprobacillaceae bacterium CR2/5/TPMF4]|nr:LysR family transcriptional regulator [Coprobacillaceae bacterium CR2/5/TPMF4]
MNLLHLKYVIEVAKAGSISKAANHLYMNQPHLSKIIKEFEETMHIKIFERTSKGVAPTKKGLNLLNEPKILSDRLIKWRRYIAIMMKNQCI